MKFAVTMSLRDAALVLAVSETRHIWREFHNVINRQKEEGKVKEIYIVPGSKNQFLIIYLVKDGDELWERLNEIPSSGLFDFESLPLADFEKGMQVILRNIDESDYFTPGSSTVK